MNRSYAAHLIFGCFLSLLAARSDASVCRSQSLFDSERYYSSCRVHYSDDHHRTFDNVVDKQALPYEACEHLCRDFYFIPVRVPVPIVLPEWAQPISWRIVGRSRVRAVHQLLRQLDIEISPLAYLESLYRGQLGAVLPGEARLLQDVTRRAIEESVELAKPQRQSESHFDGDEYELVPLQEEKAREALKGELCVICQYGLLEADDDTPEAETSAEPSTLPDIVRLRCPGRHCFHKACLSEYGHYTARCPLCRRQAGS